MSLVIYNTRTKRNEEFLPHKKGKVSMYTCGPTVYGRPHIGNYSSFLMADLLRRWFDLLGFIVTHVKNITDVGHLVADQDEGEDKVEREAKKENQNPLDLAKKYTDQYLEDEGLLKMIEPEFRPRASDFAPQMITMIEELVRKGHAYETVDGVYFSVETFPEYGKLSGNTLQGLHAGARITLDEAKKHPADFALWKKCVGANAHHILRWNSPWGDGFPGWHIECSAMSASLLGEYIDIHTGGEDNIFPHHECEIAQSECWSGKSPFVGIWLHKRRIDLQGEKMSKSIGNILTIPDILAKGFSPMDLRFMFLAVHYRTNLKFSFDHLENQRKVRLKIVEWFESLFSLSHAVPHPKGETDSTIADAKEAFVHAMNTDLNTPGALAAVFTLMNHFYSLRSASKPLFTEDLRAFQDFATFVRATFGCFDAEILVLPPDIQALLDERAEARKNKNFNDSDRLRDALFAKGYEVRDDTQGQKVRKL